MNLIKYLSSVGDFHALEDAVKIVWTLTVVDHSLPLVETARHITTTIIVIIILIIARV